MGIALLLSCKDLDEKTDTTSRFYLLLNMKLESGDIKLSMKERKRTEGKQLVNTSNATSTLYKTQQSTQVM